MTAFDPRILPHTGISVVLVIIMAVGGVGAATGVASGQQLPAAGTNVVVSNVTVSPETPEVETPTRITATIENLESSDSSIRIQHVRVIDSTGTRSDIISSVSSPGAIGVGGRMDVPVVTTFETAGQKELRIQVYGVDGSGTAFEFEHPVVVQVDEEPRVQLQFDMDDPVRNAESPFEVMVTNGESSELTSMQLTVSGQTVERPVRMINASLPRGGERRFSDDVTFTESGSQPVEATLQYVTVNGVVQTVSTTETVEVEPLTESTDLDLETRNDNGTAIIQATIANDGNAPVEDVTLEASDESGTAVATATIPDIAPTESASRTFDSGDVPNGSLTFDAAYTVAGNDRTQTATIDFRPASSGLIQLTGVEAQSLGSVTTITGSAANVGLADADAVVLSVQPAAGVEPAGPSSSYFIGTIENSDYISFELSARLSGGEETVPVQVEYTVDGERRSQVVRVSAASSGGFGGQQFDRPDGPPGGGPGGGFFGAIPFGALIERLVQLAIVLAILGGVVYYWKRRR